jgi:hypothetical protein
VRDARRIERAWLTAFADRRSPAPLVVPDAAAGYTEWHRGAYADALSMAGSLAAEEGLVLHAPLREWLREIFAERGALLYAWSAKMLEAIEYEHHNAPLSPHPGAIERALRDTLDGFVALGIDVEPLVPGSVFCWHRDICARKPLPKYRQLQARAGNPARARRSRVSATFNATSTGAMPASLPRSRSQKPCRPDYGASPRTRCRPSTSRNPDAKPISIPRRDSRRRTIAAAASSTIASR